MGVREEAQRYIDGKKIAEMGIRFTQEFRHVYPLEVHSHMLAVGPMQSFVGLAIKNGQLVTAAEVAELREQLAKMRRALTRIEKWHDEFPPTGVFWPNIDGTNSDRPMSYGACYGSNGERDYMRSVARDALS